MPKTNSSSRNAAARQSGTLKNVLTDESGGWKKRWTNKLPVGLIFPNSYAVGMSNLGFQLVYDLLNTSPDIVAERIFVPEDDAGAPKSVESGRLLADFPILLFSISFEDDYLNLVRLLLSGDIPPFAKKRTGRPITPRTDTGLPLVMAGGVVTFINPEPLAPFIDCFVIGEAEPVLPDIMALIRQRLTTETLPEKETLLLDLAQRFSSCYVPQFYSFAYNAQGILNAITPTAGLPPRVSKSTLEQPGTEVGHSTILTPHAEFANLYMTELGRGCTRGCRFCAAGFVYRPPRLWPAPAIIKALRKRPPAADRVGLLGMEMAKAEDLNDIATYLLKESCLLSFSSLRADAINTRLLDLLAASRLKTSAIAPDGGSERLRRVINKGITEEDVLTASAALLRAGVGNLKLYFMIGLPTEEDEDIEEMVALTMKVKQLLLLIGSKRGRISRLTLSVNCFIPKPWTPFQFHPFTEIGILKKRIGYLRSALADEANITIKTEKPEKSLFQAILARGDRRLAEALHDIARTGKNWRQVLKLHGIRPEDYVFRTRKPDELLPWEIINHGIDRNYLWNEYQKALRGETTSPCDTSACKRCGVCHGQ
jgi:radical SAM superfamily enzyme YgiQ (UPF0313 family)